VICSRKNSKAKSAPLFQDKAWPSIEFISSRIAHFEILDRTEDGRIVFPFEAVKVEFLLQAV
jgi:hypothetical protein